MYSQRVVYLFIYSNVCKHCTDQYVRNYTECNAYICSNARPCLKVCE